MLEEQRGWTRVNSFGKFDFRTSKKPSGPRSLFILSLSFYQVLEVERWELLGGAVWWSSELISLLTAYFFKAEP